MKWLITFVLAILFGCSNLPENISMKSQEYETNDIKFYYDLTYKNDDLIYAEHRIFDQMAEMIEEANEFIVMDVFLFNGLYNGKKFRFPEITREITEALIKKKKENKDIKIYFLTDEINTFYGAYTSSELKKLEDSGIEVILTDLTKTNGANVIYSTFWNTFFRWFGTGGIGWLPNPMSLEGPKVNLRAYLKLINLRGNHRKVVITEKEGLITSANPHNASGYHSNIGFRFSGEVINAMLDSERAVAKLSGIELDIPNTTNFDAGKDKLQLLTEGKIGEVLDSDIDSTRAGDRIDIGMFYLGDKKVIKSLVNASKRGVDIRIILDQNKEAFGMKKTGIPNKITAKQIIRRSDGKIKIKWYNSSGEQYHTKLVVINKQDKVIINGGSANLTKRNLRDYTLDTNIRIVTTPNSPLAKEIEDYYEMLWYNKENVYTVYLDTLERPMLFNRFFIFIQNVTGFSTF